MEPQLAKSGSSAGRVRHKNLTNDDVLNREIPWPAMHAQNVIDTHQLEMLFNLDKKPLHAQIATFESAPAEHVNLVAAMLANVSKDDVVQYILAVLDQMLDAKPALAAAFFQVLHDSRGTADAVAPLIKLLPRQTNFILEKSTLILAKMLSYASSFKPAAPDAHADEIVARHTAAVAEFLLTVLKTVDPVDGFDKPQVVAVLAALQVLATGASGRAAIVEAEGVAVLVMLMGGGVYTTHSAVQLLYQTVFTAWSLSYSPDAAAAMIAAKVGLVDKLVHITKTVQKEKVVRVALATLRNLIGVGSASAEMVSAGIVKALSHLRQRKWADDDVIVDIEFIAEALDKNIKNLSSWDVYHEELLSGRFDWSPSHKSTDFWRENYKHFEAHDSAALKQLVELLKAPDALTLAVACHDVAEFIQFHPEGRRLVTQLGAKTPVMNLLQHSDPDVQKHALTCMQRLMVINWEYLSGAA